MGINFLEKIQTATLSAVLGAMLAGVDYVLMGAGIPKEMPRVLTELAHGRPAHLTIEVANQTRVHTAVLDPRTYLGAELPAMRRPLFLAIISLHVLGSYLARDAEIRPDGFVVEGPVAGGHSAPPRGKLTLDERGQPIYSAKDEADITKMVTLGLPFWLAGAAGTPEALLDWTQPALVLARKVRAFGPWPIAEAELAGERLRIHAAEALPLAHAASAGTLLAASRDGLDVACGEGALRIRSLQRAGGRVITAADYLNARRDLPVQA